MSEREGTNEPGGADELEAARDALVGDPSTSTVSAEFDDLRQHLLLERESKRRSR